MFQGETAITIDDKGRLAIPTAYREEVARACGNRLVITYNPFEAGCLYLYPHAVWERCATRSTPCPGPSAPRAAAEAGRRATPVEPDGSGRISIPASHRSAVGIERKRCCWAWATSSSCGASRRTTRRSARPSATRIWATDLLDLSL
jgi:MraZ protein